MDINTTVNAPSVETIFVPGCPNIKKQASYQKPLKEQIFVANFPVITEPDIAKIEIISDEECEANKSALRKDDYNTNSNSEHSDAGKSDFEENLNESSKININQISKQPTRKHFKSEKVTEEPKFVCNICKMGFQRVNNFTIHMKKMHKVIGPATPYSCPNCPRKYEFEYELKRHMQKYRPLEERLIHPCTHCDRKFQTRVHVARHIKFVHDNIRPFICEECGEAVHTRTTLREHMLTHTDYSPFECKECGKCFKQKQRLKVRCSYLIKH